MCGYPLLPLTRLPDRQYRKEGVYRTIRVERVAYPQADGGLSSGAMKNNVASDHKIDATYFTVS